MSELDVLIEKINQEIVSLDFKSAKRMRLQILHRRYIGGERTPELIKAMKIETQN